MAKLQDIDFNNLTKLPTEIIAEILKNLTKKELAEFYFVEKKAKDYLKAAYTLAKNRILNGKFENHAIEIKVLRNLYKKAIIERDIKTLLKLPMHTEVINFLASDLKYSKLRLSKIIIHSFINFIDELQNEINFKKSIRLYQEVMEKPDTYSKYFVNGVKESIKPCFTEKELNILRSYKGLSGVTPFATIATQIQLRDILEAKEITEVHIKKLHTLIKDRKTLFTDDNIEDAPEEVQNILEYYQNLNHRLIEELAKKPINFVMLEELIKEGANVNYYTYQENKENEDFSNYEALLHYALYQDCECEVIKFLLDNGANVHSISENTRSGYQGTALHHALELETLTERDNIITLLLTYGADVNELNGDPSIWVEGDFCYNPPLYTALSNERYEWALKLIDMGTDVNFVTGKNLKDDPIAFEILKTLEDQNNEHALKIIEKALEKGMNINVKGCEGRTYLHNLALYRHNACYSVPHGLTLVEAKQLAEIKRKYAFNNIPLLIKLGADINIQDDMGNTPLHSYIKNSYPPKIDIILKLIKWGARLDIKNKPKRLLQGWEVEAVDINANPLTPHFPSQTPIDKIKEKEISCKKFLINEVEILRLRRAEFKLLQQKLEYIKKPHDHSYPLNINDLTNISTPRDEFGMTPIHHIVFAENGENYVERLVTNYKIDINAFDSFGNTALHYALKVKAPSYYNLLYKDYNINLIIKLIENGAAIEIFNGILKSNLKDENSLNIIATINLALELEKAVNQRIERLNKKISRLHSQIEALSTSINLKNNKRKRDDEEDNYPLAKRGKFEQEQNNNNFREYTK
ncbi:MAG: ankyrin repeat domain-containing protein [Sphingobacteriia bacterium]|nr:ankyrin repeat domain-containing protein [Sphingobacteriia bacterium]